MCHNLCEKLNNEWHFWLFLDDLIKELEDEEIVFVGSACLFFSTNYGTFLDRYVTCTIKIYTYEKGISYCNGGYNGPGNSLCPAEQHY